MRIREPKTEVSDWEPKNDLYSITYQIRTITPIYGGGVEAGEVDEDMPIRAAAIRGQLRYWWRFLQSHRKDGKRLEGEMLYNAERKIWGGMNTKEKNGDGKDQPVAGKVKILISDVTGVHKEPCGKYERKERRKNDGAIKITWPFQFNHRIHPYSLFCAQGKPPKGDCNEPEERPADVLLPGIKFSLKLLFRTEPTGTEEKSVVDALRWWANFGGIGARTRRGLGALEITSVKTNSNDAVPPSIVPVTRIEAAEYSCCLKTMPDTQKPRKPLDAWSDAIIKLQQFRQGENVGRRPGKDPNNKYKLGRSYWPEPDTIREITELRGHTVEHKARKCFPRAMFGLPIIFDFQNAYDEPPKTHLLPDRKDSSRMASPLIIKPVADGEGKYIPTALLLPPDHIEDLGLTLKIDNAKKEKDKLDNKVLAEFPKKFARAGGDVWWPFKEQEEEQKKKANEIEPMKNRDHDPLQAFLKFFEEN